MITGKVIFLKSKTRDDDIYQVYFNNRGVSTQFVPLLKHTYVVDKLLTIIKSEAFSEIEHIVITSQRTVNCIAAAIVPQLTDFERDQLHSKTVYAVGRATQDLLIKIGFQNVRGGYETGNGSLLAEFIIKELSSIKNSHNKVILFLVGEIRRDVIPKKLESVGVNVSEIVTYRTQKLDSFLQNLDSIVNNKDWIVFFSPQGTEHIVEQLKNKDIKIACIGPTTQDYLTKKALAPIVVSKKPEPSSLFAEILKYEEQKHYQAC